MVIELYTQEVLNDVRTKSHQEVSQISGVEERYRVEAGSEKMDQIRLCLAESEGRLRELCVRYLKETIGEDGVEPRDTIKIELVLSERRSIGKDMPLKRVMHTFLVEYTLAKFYLIVHNEDFANKHDALATSAGQRITELLYSKLPPRV